MHVTFWGAAREVTGSCHLLTVGDHTIALDCGMFQGRRTEAREKNIRFPIPPETLSAIVLSHAHIDHSGRLPYLTRNGFKGTIWATPATRDLCAAMLMDSAFIQEKDAEFLRRRGMTVVEPLYTTADVPPFMQQMKTQPYGSAFDVVPGIRVTYVDAGHILGSASVIVDCTEGSTKRRLIFSGDIGRWGQPIIRDPQSPGGGDMVIMESTYGDRDHPKLTDMRTHLASIVSETAARGGRVIIPAFAVGRTQEMIYDLHGLMQEGKIPAVPIYIDSPLASQATQVFANHPEVYDSGEHMVRAMKDLFQFDQLHYTKDVGESKALNSQRGPMIIVSPSGMAEVGRIQHHLLFGAGDPRNTILVVGFMAEHTLGRRIVERRPTLTILGEEVKLKARVEVLNGYSAHGDRTELGRWLDLVRGASPKPPPVWLVHGEPGAQDAFAARVRERGHVVSTPAPGDTATL
ncbi:MAG TPA: MBL fold metallo-hydrolase [Gemmatimonadaceae bacterium]